MTPELKAKWLAALESGDYQKGCASLRNDTGFCCLGVLADIINPDGWVDGSQQPNKHGRTAAGEMDWGLNFSRTFLPRYILSTTIQCRLAEANDVSTTFDPVIILIKEAV